MASGHFTRCIEFCYACLHNCPQHTIHLPIEAGTLRFRNEHITLKDIIESNQHEKYFGCKREITKGYCICCDGLTLVLDAICKADVLIIGSQNYLGEMSASFRALYERLVFQNLTYNREHYCYNQNPIPVLLIMTSNGRDQYNNGLLPLISCRHSRIRFSETEI